MPLPPRCETPKRPIYDMKQKRLNSLKLENPGLNWAEIEKKVAEYDTTPKTPSSGTNWKEDSAKLQEMLKEKKKAAGAVSKS